MPKKFLCSKCNLFFLANNFYLDKDKTYKVSTYCKKCYRQVKKAWRNANRAHVRKKTEENRYKYYERTLARNAAWRAIKSGKLLKKPCEFCGKKEVQAHHYKGYSKENRLKIKWFCTVCHKKVELNLKKRRRYKKLDRGSLCLTPK